VATAHQPLNSGELPLRREFARKALHLAAATLPAAYAAGAPRPLFVAILAASSVIALLVEWARRRNRTFADRFSRWFGALIRPHEQYALTGATWLALSCLLVVALLSRQAAVAAMWCATVADPAATIIGRTVAHSSPASAQARKSLPGSVAFVAAGFVGTCWLAGFSPTAALVIAVAGAVGEAVPLRFDDNARVAIIAGTVAELFA
jgi:dolichol kinase